jgi:hypothetical protein
MTESGVSDLNPMEDMSLSEANIYVHLTHAPLDVLHVMSLVKSPEAGAIVLFAGRLSSFPLT